MCWPSAGCRTHSISSNAHNKPVFISWPEVIHKCLRWIGNTDPPTDFEVNTAPTGDSPIQFYQFYDFYPQVKYFLIIKDILWEFLLLSSYLGKSRKKPGELIKVDMLRWRKLNFIPYFLWLRKFLRLLNRERIGVQSRKMYSLRSVTCPAVPHTYGFQICQWYSLD